LAQSQTHAWQSQAGPQQQAAAAAIAGANSEENSRAIDFMIESLLSWFTEKSSRQAQQRASCTAATRAAHAN
jgi:hypothetical protein